MQIPIPIHMGDTMAATTTDQHWKQFYQQPLMDSGPAPVLAPPTEGFSSATSLTTTSPAAMLSSDMAFLGPSSSYTTSATAGQLTPKGNIVFKPTRRRSRASKRTPTTLLNANTTNFRALVQQFTGCPRTALPLGVHKGPITLDFRRRQQQEVLHRNTAKITASFGNNKVEKLAQQQNVYSFHSSSSNSRADNMEVCEGLIPDNDFGLHELTVNDFSIDL